MVYLKCGFCKKSFIMNDFLRNLLFSPYILCSPGFTVEQKRLCKLGEQFTQNSLICRGDNPAKLKFLYFEKATKFCETFTLLWLQYILTVKSKVKISQNFLAFSEYMNFKMIPKAFFSLILRWSPYFHILCKAYFIDLNHLWQYGL